MLGEQLAGSLLLLLKDGVQNGDVLLITYLIAQGPPCGNANQVQIVYQAAHQLGGILIVKGVHQRQMELVVQINEGGGGLSSLPRLIVLMLQQQGPHVGSPLEVHLIKTLPEDHGLQEGTDFKNIMDALGRWAGDFDAFAGMDLYQIVLSQCQNSFPYRCTAQPQGFLQLRLIDKLAGSEIFLQDHGLDLIIRQLGQTGLPFAIDRCHRQLPSATTYQNFSTDISTVHSCNISYACSIPALKGSVKWVENSFGMRRGTLFWGKGGKDLGFSEQFRDIFKIGCCHIITRRGK